MRGQKRILLPATACLVGLFSSGSAFAQDSFKDQVGLKGEYFANRNLSGKPVLVRADRVVNFGWGDNSPKKDVVPGDNFSVRWSGRVMAPVSGSYTFYTVSDDGVRLTVNGKRVINNWTDHSTTEDAGTPITLEGGKWYPIVMEYFENGGDAVARLRWQYPGQKKVVIPETMLRADGDVGSGTPVDPGIPAPTGVSAVGLLSANAPVIDVSWGGVSGAASYNIYRDGTQIANKLTQPKYRDAAVKSGQTYTYKVTAISATAKESPQSGAATATAPFPTTTEQPASTLIPFGAPSNLLVQASGSTDVLSWTPVKDAVAYNVYQYDTLIARGVTGTKFTVPTSVFMEGLTYTVTAVNSSGSESLPSAMAGAVGNQGWTPPRPKAMTNVRAVPEWNAGAPRVRLEWNGSPNAWTYNVYRDGTLIAKGVWGVTFLDHNVKPGVKYSYTVSGANTAEGPKSAAASVTTITAPPAKLSTPVKITKVVPNDDSVQIHFEPVPGAVDYRCYKVSAPGTKKYSAGGLVIEMNAINTTTGDDLVVEALDKFGPYQKMDGEYGPGAMQHDGSLRAEINGIGDPSNVPNVIAKSAVFKATCTPVKLTGSQVFFDNFRGSQPFKQVFPIDQRIVAANGGGANDANNPYVREYQNDKWVIRNYWGDMDNTKIFVMSNHFMDTLYDGGTPGSNMPPHNNNASLVMMPKATADISGGKVLHVTMEVDGHFNGRRWCDIFVAPADDPLIKPGKFADSDELPNISGNMFRWEILEGSHEVQLFRKKGNGLDQLNLLSVWGEAQRSINTPPGLIRNGTMAELDKRHKYDLYLSANRFRVLENGVLIEDRVFPNGRTLPFTKLNVYFVHQLYHTANDRAEVLEYTPYETYWINHRPWADERHWDNMGFEVLNSFPAK